jgi:hypothetical protein
MSSARIPIYAQYYDETNTLVTKEVTYKEEYSTTEQETAINVTLDEDGPSTKIRYFPSDIKFAGSQTRRWAERMNIKGAFITYVLTLDASPDWWTIQPRESSFVNGYYTSETISMYKRKGLGIIIRSSNLPRVETKEGRKTFTEELIPF